MPERYKEIYIAFFMMMIITGIVVGVSAVFGFYTDASKLIVGVGIVFCLAMLQVKPIVNKMEQWAKFLFRHKVKPWMIGLVYFVVVAMLAMSLER